MERSLFSFIWKHSRREQLFLLLVTVITFPLLFVTLELPKRIINDAIGATSSVVNVFGFEMTQIQFLLLLSFGYLASVLAHGLVKMRLNTMKGVVSERMLRRFRYTLISRMMRFPKPYFQRTSQGELVSMVTSEAEPMGGLMGDAIAQPVFQAGQMIIIVFFLFLQSVWFGLAGIALIPLQAWIIPMLQRQINQLNKKRIIQVRHLASEIGETAEGMQDLRLNGGWRYRRAQFTQRLGRLFDIRFQIYQKKFFMKFLNNFITQLTPFFFYSVGGYLAIKGEITVGALVAALAAYKDLSAPWKELLTYYNQVQDMSLRWQIVTERFAPADMIDEALFEGEPESVPHLRDDIAIHNVTVRNSAGSPVLEDINVTIPAGSRVAIKVSSQAERGALADLLTREVLPTGGSVHIGATAINNLHQAVIAARIGYAGSRPHFFDGTLGSNLMMPLRNSPKTVEWSPGEKRDRAAKEARKSGNSTDTLNTDWTDPSIAEFTDDGDIHGWWYRLVQAMGIDGFMFRRMLSSMIDPGAHPDLVKTVVGLRDEVAAAIHAKDLDDIVHRFHPDTFNPTVPLGGNLLFAAPRAPIAMEELASEGSLLGLIMEQGLGEQAIAISQTVVDNLHHTFGKDGTDHPLFQALGIAPALYEQLTDIAMRRKKHGDGALSEDEFALLLTVPFLFTAEQIGDAFPTSFKDEILEIRRTNGADLRASMDDLFIPLDPDTYLPRLSLMENLLYGRVSRHAGPRGDLVQDVVSEVLERHSLQQKVVETIWDIDAGTGGGELPTVFQERAAFSRAAIKRPDILILDKALASHDAESRSRTRSALRDLMPDTTLIFMEDDFSNPDAYDLFIEIKNGRIGDVDRADHMDLSAVGADDLDRKLRLIAQTELFAQLEPRNQRLLAFSAQWHRVEEGQVIFAQNDPPDATYLCIKGQAQMSWTDDQGNRFPISTIDPGRVIGDLAVILDEPRQLDLIATQDSVFLRIGAPEYLSVVQNDVQVAVSLLKTVSGHLTTTAEIIRDAGLRVPDDIGPPNAPLEDPEKPSPSDAA